MLYMFCGFSWEWLEVGCFFRRVRHGVFDGAVCLVRFPSLDFM